MMIFKSLILLCGMVLCQGCVLKCSKTPDLSSALSKGISSNGFVNIGPSTFVLNVFRDTKDKQEAKPRALQSKNFMSDVMTDFFPIDVVPDINQKHIFADIDTPCRGSPCSQLHREPRNGLPPLTSLLGDNFGKIISQVLEKPRKENKRFNTGYNAGEIVMIEVIPDKKKKSFVKKSNTNAYLPIHKKNAVKHKVPKSTTPAEEVNKLSDFDTDDNNVKVEEEPVKGIIMDKNEISVKVVSEDTSTIIPEMSS